MPGYDWETGYMNFHTLFHYLARAILILALLTALCGCNIGAAPYRKADAGDLLGYSEHRVSGDVWHVGFNGNINTTSETVQAYWLYRCAELALAMHYDGFEIISNIRLTMTLPASALNDTRGIEKVNGTIYTPIYIPSTGNTQKIEADVRFLHGAVIPAPPIRYNAAELKRTLDPIVNGKKCDDGNVCPHVHDYIYGPVDTTSS